MKYAAIRTFDVTNGLGNGISLFVSGCHFHCYQCFNPETWDFNYGKEWTSETEQRFIDLAGRSYIKRISFLGGSPLCNENVGTVYHIIKQLKEAYPDKKIWVYTGYTWEAINSNITFDSMENTVADQYRKDILRLIDVLVDGPFVYEERDLTLAFRGSSNQRIIDVQKSLSNKEVVLWNSET